LSVRSDRRLIGSGALGPGIIWAGLLALVFGGRLFTTDVAAQYQVAESLLGARPLFTADCGWTVRGVRSESYVPHGIGYSLVMLPAAGVGLLLGEPSGKVTGAAIGAFASIALLYSMDALGRGFFGRIDRRRLVPVMLGCMGLVYGRMPYDVTAATAFALWGAVFMHRRRFFAAGVLLGAAILVRLDSVLLLPVYWMGAGEKRGYLTFFRALIPFALIVMAYNHYRFGGVFDDGHGQDPAMAVNPGSIGIVGLLFSPGKGLLWYAPMWVAAAVSCRKPRLWLPFVLSLLLHGFLYDWTGGTGWGPRFLFHALPLLFLPLLEPGAGGRAFAVLAVPALAVSLLAGFTDTNALERSLGPDHFHTAGRQSVIWSPSRSPLVNTIASPAFNGPDILGYRVAGVLGAAVQTALGLGLITTGILVTRRRSS